MTSCEVVFYVVRDFIVSGVAIAFKGHSVGPVLPTSMAAISKVCHHLVDFPIHAHLLIGEAAFGSHTGECNGSRC